MCVFLHFSMSWTRAEMQARDRELHTYVFGVTNSALLDAKEKEMRR